MLRTVVVGFVFVLTLAWAAGASGEMKEGLWEMTMKVEMKGMPNQMAPITMKQCMTKKDMVPKPQNTSQSGQECKMKDQKITGDTVTYGMECKGADGSLMQTSGRMSYKGDVFDGSSTTSMKGKGQAQSMQMNTKMSGRYLGPCTK